jgi:NAD(P)-dependent dehydrogenase (short-subunit alcohol dehydrogenase family)
MGCRRDAVIELCREAVSIKCDVTRWDEQVALFELAIARFDAVDVVVSSTVRLAPFPSFTETPAQGKT